MENKEYKFCPSCGQALNESKEICPKCGLKFNTESIIERLTPTTGKMLEVKRFIINNFRLMHVVYLLVFLAGLMSAKFGLLCLMIVGITTYALSVLRGNTPIFASDEKVTEKSLISSDNQDEKQSINEQEPVDTKISQENETYTQANTVLKNTETTKTIIKSRSRFGILEISLVAASVMSLFGIFIGGFFKFSDASLFKLLTDVSTLIGYAENAETIMTGSSSNNATSIQLIGYLLVIIPIFVSVLGLMKSRLANAISCIGAIGELVFLIYCITKLVNIYKQVPQFIVHRVPNILGAPLYILIVSVFVMTIASIAIWVKTIISSGVEISQ